MSNQQNDHFNETKRQAEEESFEERVKQAPLGSIVRCTKEELENYHPTQPNKGEAEEECKIECPKCGLELTSETEKCSCCKAREEDKHPN